MANSFKMGEYVKLAFKLVKKETADFTTHENILQERLGVSITTLPNLKNHIVTKFKTQQELEQAVLGSCTMSPLAGMPFRLNREHDKELHNQWVFDGGLSNIQPFRAKDKSEVVTISAFSHWDDVNIRPSKYVPVWWGLHPSSVRDMDTLFYLGMQDAKTFVNSRDFDPEVVQGAELEKLIVADEEMSAYSFVNEGQEGTLKRRLALEFDHVEEDFQNKAMDGAAQLSYRTVFKGLAFASVYAEMSYLTVFNLGRGVAVGLEKKRRILLPASQHGLSIRRWIPKSLLGSSSESMSKSVSNFQNLFKFNEIWGDVSKAIDSSEGESDIDVPNDLEVKSSFFFRHFVPN